MANLETAKKKKLTKNEWIYMAMLLPGVVLLLVFHYLPMAGIVIAFQKFIPTKGVFGSPWVGLQNFQYMLEIPEIGQIMFNTVFIACSKLLLGLVVPIIFALLLNEMCIRDRGYGGVVGQHQNIVFGNPDVDFRGVHAHGNAAKNPLQGVFGIIYVIPAVRHAEQPASAGFHKRRFFLKIQDRLRRRPFFRPCRDKLVWLLRNSVGAAA